MGTNFYLRGHRYDNEPGFHVGKRSAAGMYCWDCKITLCKDGAKRLHYGNSEWYDLCPTCLKAPQKESLSDSSAGRELGFNKSTPHYKTGVATCSSFNWAIKEEELESKIKENTHCSMCGREWEPETHDQVIEDEYGNLYTLKEFIQVLSECPIIYKDSIGQNFS